MKTKFYLLIFCLFLLAKISYGQINISTLQPARNALNQSNNVTIQATITGGAANISAGTLNFTNAKVYGSQTGFYTAGAWTGGGTNTISYTPPTYLFKSGETVTVEYRTTLQSNLGETFTTTQQYQFTARATGTGIFTKPNPDVATGTNAQSVVAFDADGDGDMDLATANDGGNSVSVLKNNGVGIYSAATNYTVGTRPLSVYVFDADGDGDMDLATANWNSNNISLLKNDGTGTYGAATNFVVGLNPHSIYAFDADGDGDMDLATANEFGNNVSILKNDGTGAYGASTYFAVGTAPRFVYAFDADGDGDMDLAVANNANNSVSILKNDGTGTYSAATNYTVGANPFSVYAFDADGDGDVDLATANDGSNSVSVLTNDGTGAYSTATNFAVGANPLSVYAFDADGDGDMDLAVTNLNNANVSVLKNNGTGTYGAATNFLVGTAPHSVYAFDADNDGDMDLAVANRTTSNVSILFNQSPLNITALSPARNALNVTTNTPIVTTFSATPNAPNNSKIKIMGSQTGFYTATSFTGTNPLTINHTQNFKAGETVTVEYRNTLQGSLGENFITTQQYQFTAAATGGFANFIKPNPDVSVSTTPVFMCSFDADGDGDIDVASANFAANSLSVSFNNGDGTFTAPTNYLVGTNPRSVFAFDADNDGDLDLACANDNSNNISVLFNNGSGFYSGTTNYAVGTNPYDITAFDADGDGDLDLAVAVLNNSSVSIFLNNGSGTFVLNAHYTVPAPFSIFAFDADSDGDIDIATTNNTGNLVSIIFNNGNGTYTPSTDYATGGTACLSVFAFDCDSDGDMDLAVANSTSNNLGILKNNGNGIFGTATNYATGTTPWGISAFDANGDGNLDLASSNYGSNNISVLLNNGAGSGTFAAAQSFTFGSNPRSLSAFDADADGDMDLAMVNEGANTISILFNQAPLTQIQGVITELGTGLDGVLLTDSNGFTTITAANGFYTAFVSAPFTGTLTPSKLNYVFTPAVLNFTNISTTQINQNFTGLTTYPIQGVLMESPTLAIQNALITDSNGFTTISDANGFYTAFVSSGYTGTLTPSSINANYVFTPTNLAFSTVLSAQINQDFSGATTYPIQGVLTEFNSPISNALITDSKGFTTVSDVNGFYTAFVSSGFIGTVTPSKANYIFTPTDLSFNKVYSAQIAQNFSGMTIYSIQGTVTELNLGLKDVLMTYNGFTTVSDANGFYTAFVSSGFSGKITPSKDFYTFVSADLSFTTILANQINQNFTGITNAVTNTSDSGAGSLRALINYASQNFITTNIVFKIPFSDPNYNPITRTWTIKLTTELPSLSKAMIIDASTQLGFSTSQPVVRLDGNGNKLFAFNLASPNVEIYGFEITNFKNANGDGTAINVKGSQNNFVIGKIQAGNVINNCDYGIVVSGVSKGKIQGNKIGTEADGKKIKANRFTGVQIANLSKQIAVEDNIISGNDLGIDLKNSQTNLIKNNWIEANKNGISVNNLSSDNVLESNVIGNQTKTAVILDNTSKDTLRNNFIGQDKNGKAMPNDYNLWLNKATNNLIGGKDGQGNVIANALTEGIYFTTAEISTKNAIRRNTIFCNAKLGIALNANNNDKQSPSIAEIGKTEISGFSDPNDEIDVFLDMTSCTKTLEQGKIYVGSAKADKDGKWTLSQTFNSTDKLTATATDVDGNTSPFSLVKIPSVRAEKVASGNALAFDGKNYLEITQNSSLDFGKYTFEFWVKPTAYKNAHIISRWGDTGAKNASFVLLMNDLGKIGIDHHNGANSLGAKFSNKKLALNAWTHVAISFDGATISVYLNGIKDLTVNSSIVPQKSTYPIRIANEAKNVSGDQFFKGELDEIRLWNVAKTETEIRTYMCRKVKANANLLAYFRFDADNGAVAADYSLSNDAKLINDPVWKTSGASIGDSSAFSYANSLKNVIIKHKDGDSFTVFEDSRSKLAGLQVYIVSNSPNTNEIPSNIEKLEKSRYFGVFAIADSEKDTANYFMNYKYAGNTNIDGKKENNISIENRIKMLYRQNNAGKNWLDLEKRLELSPVQKLVVINDFSQKNRMVLASGEFIVGISNCIPTIDIEVLAPEFVSVCKTKEEKIDVKLKAKLTSSAILTQIVFYARRAAESKYQSYTIRKRFKKEKEDFQLVDSIFQFEPSTSYHIYAIAINDCGNTLKSKEIIFRTPVIFGENKIGNNQSIYKGDDPKFKPIIDLGLKPTSPDSTQITVRWQKADTRNGEWVDMDTTIKDHTNIDSLLEKSNLADTATFSRDTVEIDTTSKFVLKGYALEKTTFFRRILSVKDCADTSNVVRIEVLDITKAEAAKADAAFLYNFYSNYGFGGWDRNRPISEWAGVVLENGRLVGLDLHLTNLTGEVPNFPPLIANSLKYVNFSNNQLSGKIPDHVAEWANLEYLDLSGNDLEGEVPESLGSLVKLKTIYLAHNRLTSIPEKLFDNLTELRSLFLNNNQLSVLPKNINRLKSLEFLNLGNNLLREIPEEISELSNLQLLYFNNNRLTKLPLSLEKLTNLKGLFLQNNLLTDLISFAKLESLEQLDVHGNALDFADLEIFANKGGRTSLNVSYIPQALFGNIQDIFAIAETRQFLNVNTAGTANKYQWYKDDKKINIASATTNQLEIFRASQADQGVYKVLVTNSKVPNLTLTSQEIRLTVSCNTFAVNVSVQGSANFCENTNSEPVLTATLLPNVSYQWTFDGKNMSGENTNILKATESGKYAVLVEDKAKCVAISNEILVQKLTSPKVIIKIEGKDRDILQADFFGNTQIQSYQWFKNDELLATKTDFISAEGTASYYLKAIDQNGCVGISNLITFVPTSLENEFLAKEIKVYPNPSSGIYQIESPSPISLVVYNALGQKLDVNSAKTENNYLLDLSAMPSGIYLLEIKDAKGFCIKKLIKN